MDWNMIDEIARIKRTPYGRINIYSGYGIEFVLSRDVFKLAEVYARKNNWTEQAIKGIGGVYPF